jgi:hypothetical protein
MSDDMKMLALSEYRQHIDGASPEHQKIAHSSNRKENCAV